MCLLWIMMKVLMFNMHALRGWNSDHKVLWTYVSKKQKLSLNVGVLILLQLDFSEREAHVQTATVVAGSDFQSHGLEG